MSDATEGCMIRNNPIVALRSVIVTVCKGRASESSYFGLKDGDEWWVSGSVARTSAI